MRDYHFTGRALILVKPFPAIPAVRPFLAILQVLKKLPITLDVLTTLTGVGRHVKAVAASKMFDEGQFLDPSLTPLRSGGKSD
jgi:hypothetical protein